MGTRLNVGRRSEWGVFNLSLLALQVDPEAWWLAYLWAAYRERVSANVRGRSEPSHFEGFIVEDGSP
ncbi:MAG: hypothetical protein ACRD3C_05800 [Vicinamibacterales bacterium]